MPPTPADILVNTPIAPPRRRAALAWLLTASAWLPGACAVADRSPAAPATPAAPAEAANATPRPATLIGAQEYTLPSPETGRTYRIQLAAIGPQPAGGYPVLYVLDGDALFPVVATAAQGMVMRAQENNATPLLVVGVGYPGGQLLDLAARAEDYTPASASYAQTGDRLSRRFGGAEPFHRFLTGTLRQDIARRFATQAQQQALLGHSYGGLFALHTLLTQPDSFQHYLIASPSVWWNQRRVLQDWPAFAQRPHPPVGVRLSVGEYEQTLAPHMAPNAQRQATLAQRGMVREVQALARQLAALPASKVSSHALAIYPGETHASSVMPAINDGLKWLFARHKAAASPGEAK